MLLTVSQPDIRFERRADSSAKLDYNPVGITVLGRKNDVPAGAPVNLHTHKILQRTRFWNKRDVCMEFDLSSAPTGIAPDTDFVVIPSTYFPEVEGSFRLTATGSKTGDAKLLSRHTTTSEAFPFQQSIASAWTIKNAGGAYKSSSRTFKRNPIFTLTVEEDDTDVCLTLRQHRKKQTSKKSAGKQRGIKWLKIGIYLFHSSVELQSVQQSDKVCASTFINLPEVSVFPPKARKLAAGTYLVVCTTYEPNLQATFALTALSDKKCVLELGRTKSAQPAKLTASKVSKPRGKGKTTKNTGKRGRRKKSGPSTVTFQKAQQTSTMLSDLYANF